MSIDDIALAGCAQLTDVYHRAGIINHFQILNLLFTMFPCPIARLEIGIASLLVPLGNTLASNYVNYGLDLQDRKSSILLLVDVVE